MTVHENHLIRSHIVRLSHVLKVNYTKDASITIICFWIHFVIKFLLYGILVVKFVVQYLSVTSINQIVMNSLRIQKH